MSSVDKRVVEMQFNNKQFEKDMATTVKSLKNFEKNLEFKNGGKGLDNVTKSVSHLENRTNNMDFSKFEKSVNSVSSRLSTMGIVAMTTIQNMSTDIYNTIKNKFTSLYDTVMGKGMNRALNLEQANFQLMGLLKNEEKVAQVMEDVDYGVKDTAYGLDEAAKVASQLAASNVTAGEYMKSALRGISGVAAMTSSSYEEIGNIFTRVAGQGRVMATDLNSIAARGLNAAATIADFLGTTEEEVRDMVSKGSIDFKTFATAMDEAFGEHAKEANKTFTGAMQNVQAALGRVGAGFKQPYIKFMRPVLVQLIQNINAVKDAFGPLYDTTSFIFEKISNFAINILGNFVGVRKEGEKEIKTVSSLRESLQKMHDFIIGNWNKIANVINFATIKIGSFLKTLKPIGDILSFVFRDALGSLVSIFGKLNKNNQNDFISKLGEDLNILYGNFVRAWPTVKSIISSGFKIIKGIFSFIIGIVKPVKEAFIEAFPLKEILDLLKNTVNLFGSSFGSLSKTIKIFTNDGKALKTIFVFLFSLLRVIVSILNRLIPVIRKISIFISDFSNKNLEKVRDAFLKLIEPVKKFKSSISGINRPVFDASRVFEGFNKVLEISGNIFNGVFSLLKNTFKDLIPLIKTIGSALIELSKRVLNAFVNITKNVDLDSFFKGGIIAGLISLIVTFKRRIQRVIPDFAGVVNNVRSILFQFKNLLVSYQREINAKAIKQIAISIAILAGSLLVISSIPEKDLWRSIGAIGALFGELIGAFKLLTEVNGKFKIKDMLAIMAVSNAMQNISVAILVLAVSLKVLSSLSWEELFVGLTGISVLLGEIIGISRSINKNAKSMDKTAKSMISIAIAIRILASAAKVFAKFSWEELAKAGTAITGLTGVFVGLSRAFNAKGKSILKGSLAMILFAESIKKLVEPLNRLSKFSWEELGKAGTAIAGLTLILSGFSRLVKGGSLLLASSGLLLLSISLKSIVPNLKTLGSMKWEELGKAGTAIAGLTLILSGFSRLVKGGSLLLASSGLLLLSISLKSIVPNLKTLGSMKWEELGKAGTAIAGLISIFAAFSILAKPGKLILLSTAMLILASAISVFVIEFKALSNIGLEGVLVSLTAIAGIFTTIGLAGKMLKKSIPTILKLSAALLLIGAGFGIAGFGLSAFIGAIAATGATIKGIVDGIIDLFKGILELIPHFFKKIGEGLAELITVFVTMLSESLPELFKAITKIIDETIPFILENVPKIANAIIDLIIAVIDTVTANIPKIAASIKNLFAAFLTAIYSYGKTFKIEDLFWAIQAVALIAGLIYVLQVISSDMKSALKGIALMAIVLGAVVGALVILNQFTNVDKTVELIKGLSVAILSLAGVFAIIGIVSTLMTRIAGPQGTIIGLLIGIVGFVVFVIAMVATFGAIGAIINAIGDDAIAAFDTAVIVMQKIGQALGNFFGTIVSAFSGIISNSNISETTLLAIVPIILALEPLTLALPILTAFVVGIGAVMNSLDEAFNGAATNSLEKAIEVMPLIGEAIGGFLGSLAGTAIKFISKGLAASFTIFADSLSEFMAKLQPFINSLKTINGDLLERSGQLALIILEMCGAELITGITKFLSIFTGGPSLIEFASMLSDMAPYLVSFSKKLTEGNFNGDTAQKAANCALMMSKVMQNLPRENGVVQYWAGTAMDMDTFGQNLEGFAVSLNNFAKNTSHISPEQVDKITALLPMVETLVNIANAMPKDDGIWQKLAGTLTDMDDFGEQIAKLGVSLNDLAANTSHISGDQIETIKKLVPIVGDLVDIGNGLSDTGGVWQLEFGGKMNLEQFGSHVASMGESLQKFAVSTSKISAGNITSSENALKILASMVSISSVVSNNNMGNNWFINMATGGMDIETFSTKLPKIGEALAGFAEKTKNIPNQYNARTAAEAVQAIAVGFSSITTNGNVDDIKKFIEYLNKLVGDEYDGILIKAADLLGDDNGIAQKAQLRAQAVGNALKYISDGLSSISDEGDLTTRIQNFMSSLQSFIDNKHNFIQFIGTFGSKSDAESAKERASVLGDIIGSYNSAFKNITDASPDNVKKFMECVALLEGSSGESLNFTYTRQTLGWFSTILGNDPSTAKERISVVTQALNDISNSFKHMDGINTDKVKKFTEAVNGIANLSIDTIVAGFDSRMQEAVDAAGKLIDGILAGFAQKEGTIKISVAAIVLIISKAFSDNRDDAASGMRNVMDACVETMNSYNQQNDTGAFYNAGADAVAGYAKGIESNIQKAIDAGVLIGQKSLEGARSQKALNEHSPSKAFGEIAYFGVLGLVNEFAARASMAFTAGQNLGNSAMEGTKSIVANISDIINSDMNLQPVIRPVLDLSDINSQSGLIGGMLNAGGSYQLAGRTAALIEQNRADRRNARINQNGSKDVVDSVNNLTSRMDSLEQAILNRPIVMDGVKVTKQIAPSMDKELGQRRYYSRRGN